jgi:hypothetical protein
MTVSSLAHPRTDQNVIFRIIIKDALVSLNGKRNLLRSIQELSRKVC